MHDVAFPLPPAAVLPADDFHDSCLSAMEAASHLWEPRRKLSEYLDASLLADHVHHTCTHQVGYPTQPCKDPAAVAGVVVLDVCNITAQERLH